MGNCVFTYIRIHAEQYTFVRIYTEIQHRNQTRGGVGDQKTKRAGG